MTDTKARLDADGTASFTAERVRRLECSVCGKPATHLVSRPFGDFGRCDADKEALEGDAAAVLDESPFTAESRPERCNGRDDHEVYRRSDGSEFCRQCGALLKSAQQDSGVDADAANSAAPKESPAAVDVNARVAPSGGDSVRFPLPWRTHEETTCIRDARGKLVLRVANESLNWHERVDIAARIVAAVNATAPINTVDFRGVQAPATKARFVPGCDINIVEPATPPGAARGVRLRDP